MSATLSIIRHQWMTKIFRNFFNVEHKLKVTTDRIILCFDAFSRCRKIVTLACQSIQMRFAILKEKSVVCSCHIILIISIYDQAQWFDMLLRSSVETSPELYSDPAENSRTHQAISFQYFSIQIATSCAKGNRKAFFISTLMQIIQFRHTKTHQWTFNGLKSSLENRESRKVMDVIRRSHIIFKSIWLTTNQRCCSKLVYRIIFKKRLFIKHELGRAYYTCFN